MKKILIFIDWYEPGYKAGGPIRSVKNLVDQLKGEVDFYIFTRDRDYQSDEAYIGLQTDQWVAVEPNIKVWYASPAKLNRRVIQQAINSAPFHRIYLNGIYSYKFSILPLLVMTIEQKEKTIVAPRGMLARSAIGVKVLKKSLFLGLARFMKLYNGVQFHATSLQEKKDIQDQLGQGVPVVIATNLSAKSGAAKLITAQKKAGELKLVNIARVSPEKNTLFAIKALKDLPSSIKLELNIFGPVYDEDYWKECLQAIESLPSNISVTYKGNLPNEEVPDTLSTYHFFYLPSRGENFGHSILEALSAGIPVIISDQTPWKELKEKGIGFELPLSEEKFREAIITAAGFDHQEFNKWSTAAFSYAKEVREDPKTLAAYREMFGLGGVEGSRKGR